MGVILILEAIFSTFFIIVGGIVLTILFIILSAVFSKDYKFIIAKILSTIFMMVPMTLLTAWNYYLAYGMSFDFPGEDTAFWSLFYIFNMIGMMGITVYPWVIERTKIKVVWHCICYALMVVLLVSANFFY